MNISMMQKTSLALAITLSCSAGAWAQDSKLRSEGIHYGEDGWDGSLGVAVVSGEGELYIGGDDTDASAALIGGITYRNGRFFFALGDENGVQIGYSLMQRENWVVDGVFGPVSGVDFGGNDDNDELNSLDDRDVDGHLGVRYTWYGDSNRLSFGASRDVINVHDGWTLSAQYSQEWQVKNWLVTGNIGAAHLSDKSTNHVVGVSASEATAAIPAFDAEAGNVGWLDFKAEYPVTEKWVFQTRLNTLFIGDELSDSPITEDDSRTLLLVGMKYQF